MSATSLNPTAASLLGFLHDGPLTGWQLAARAKATIGDFWTVTQSQVYRELASMAESGLVEAGERGARERLPYRLTDPGRRAFAAWVALPPDLETIRFPLLLKLSFGRHLPPERLASFVAQHRAVHRERLERYEAQASAAATQPGLAAADVFRRATLSFGLAYERAVAGWFEELEGLVTAVAEAPSEQ